MKEEDWIDSLMSELDRLPLAEPDPALAGKIEASLKRSRLKVVRQNQRRLWLAAASIVLITLLNIGILNRGSQETSQAMDDWTSEYGLQNDLSGFNLSYDE